MTEKNNIFSIVASKPVEEAKNVIVITYSDGSDELLEADAFAESDQLNGYVLFWRDEPYELLGFINSRFIKKIRIIPQEGMNG